MEEISFGGGIEPYSKAFFFVFIGGSGCLASHRKRIVLVSLAIRGAHIITVPSGWVRCRTLVVSNTGGRSTNRAAAKGVPIGVLRRPHDVRNIATTLATTLAFRAFRGLHELREPRALSRAPKSRENPQEDRRKQKFLERPRRNHRNGCLS